MHPDSQYKTYATADLCFLIPGVTARQLQWWDERKLIMPHHEGHRREYGIEDALAVAIIADLRRKGLPLQRIRTVLRLVQRETGRLLSAIRGHGGQAYLAIYGKSVVIETSPEKLLDHLSAVSRECHVVNVAHQVEILNPESTRNYRLPPLKAFRASV